MVLPFAARIGAWVWAELTTSAPACSRGGAIGGPGVAGAAILLAVEATVKTWRARGGGASGAETATVVVASAVLSVFFVAVAIAVWETSHGCSA